MDLKAKGATYPSHSPSSWRGDTEAQGRWLLCEYRVCSVLGSLH
jgi:hypothetical protein